MAAPQFPRVGESEKALQKWAEAQRSLRAKLREVEELKAQLTGLEAEFPFLGNFKGLLNRKDGAAARLPYKEPNRDPSPTAKACPAASTPSRKKRGASRSPQRSKKRSAPLLEKSRREARTALAPLQKKMKVYTPRLPPPGPTPFLRTNSL